MVKGFSTTFHKRTRSHVIIRNMVNIRNMLLSVVLRLSVIFFMIALADFNDTLFILNRPIAALQRLDQHGGGFWRTADLAIFHVNFFRGLVRERLSFCHRSSVCPNIALNMRGAKSFLAIFRIFSPSYYLIL